MAVEKSGVGTAGIGLHVGGSTGGVGANFAIACHLTVALERLGVAIDDPRG